jgi:hypothetical protein
MAKLDTAHWETSFCLPFYRGGFQDTNTAYMAAHSVIAGPGEDLLGIYVVTPHARWSGMNLAFLCEPVMELPNLRRRLERAAAYFRERNLAWTFVAAEDWIAPELRDAIPTLCRESSLTFVMETFSMAGRIQPQPLPPNLEIRVACSPEMWRDFADINAEAWNVPAEWTREILAIEAPWKARTEGYVCYVGAEAAACVMAYAVQGVTYVSWGATRLAHRRKGFGEAAIRHAAVRQLGGPDALLIASPMGVKPWRTVGFETVAKFSVYVSADRTD